MGACVADIKLSWSLYSASLDDIRSKATNPLLSFAALRL